MRTGLLVLVLAAVAHAETSPAVVIRNARVVPVSGPVLERGSVLIRDGLIAAVGADLTIPNGTWIIEGAGLTVYPGLIDALSTWGLPEAAAPPTRGSTAATPSATAPARGPEDRPATTSWLKAADLVRPSGNRLEPARAAGFTTAVAFPHTGIVAGHGAVINLAGDSTGRMIVDPSAGLYVTFTTAGFNSFPGSLMGVIAYVRQLWLDAAQYREAGAIYARHPVGLARPAYDRALEGVLTAPRVLLPANSKFQIERMVRFGAELKTAFVLYGAHDAYRAVDALKQARVPVIINANWPAPSRDADPDEEPPLRELVLRDQAPSTPAALAAAGVPFAFSSDGIETPRDFIRAVRKAIIAGLKPEQALRALTLGAAEIYGVSDRLGSLEPGKIANLTIVKGDLFDEYSSVPMVIIDGVKYEPAPESPRTGPPGAARTAPTEDRK